MQIELGWTYSFKFIDDFVILNGIYTAVKIYSYEEFVQEGNDLYSLLYTRVGKSEIEFDKDAEVYKTEGIYKLRNPENLEDIIYIPESIIAEVPNFNIKKYSKLVLTYNIGVYPQNEDISGLVNTIQDAIRPTLGLAEDPLAIAIKHIWLTDEEYNTELATRLKNKQVTNYYTKWLDTNRELTRTKGTVNRFNELFKSWANSNITECKCYTSVSRYIQVDTEEQKKQLTAATLKVNDFVEVKETRIVYKVVSLVGEPSVDPITKLTDNSDLNWFIIYDISDPTLINVVTEINRLELTKDKVQNGDYVFVEDTKSLYIVQDNTNLNNESGYKLLICEVNTNKQPRLITVKTNKNKLTLTKKDVSEKDYVLVEETSCLYRVVSTVNLDLESSYELVLKQDSTTNN